ncbi:hypothetical protein SODALDRAFT_153537 [Sodiomyces alkalinus F11]|uniref:Uncharacterized protein n=1 Tax=Sodiomyces alkalinus (strain CBS 110278 / VKM F-3762 / F11) TaxID=1314773 RepID=A0A3N2PXG9_SODAK|nr:hypothetical protein SODALDRAFT_153537 [Sodiomyces alkalinus F11]ROT39168.1 hypothetical protein SODALDRAFT_153537 [Sodiomyces alkalinus F11]
MPDRSHPPPPPPPATTAISTHDPTTSSTAPPAPRRGMSRSLFKSHLMRRPTSGAVIPSAGVAAPPSSSSNNSAETLRLPNMDIHSDDASPELVVRNTHGEIEIFGDLPISGMLDDGDEGVLHDQEEPKSEFFFFPESPESNGRLGVDADLGCYRCEEERQRLADAVKQHQLNHSAVLDHPEGTYIHPVFISCVISSIILPAAGFLLWVYGSTLQIPTSNAMLFFFFFFLGGVFFLPPFPFTPANPLDDVKRSLMTSGEASRPKWRPSKRTSGCMRPGIVQCAARSSLSIPGRLFLA